MSVRFWIFRFWILLTLAALLSGCGFHLRGQTALPFENVYVEGGSPDLNRLLRASIGTGDKLAADAQSSAAVLTLVEEVRAKEILSLSGGGRVREYLLRYTVRFRAVAGGREVIPLSDVTLTRDFPYDDSQALAKEGEEALLFQDMQRDAAQQILRRLAASG